MADGWGTVPLGELATVFDGPHATPKRTQAGPWYLSISSLSEGKLDLAQSARLSEEDYAGWTRRVRPMPGDTLFSYETRLGEAAHWSEDVPAALGRRMGLLRPKPGVDPRFLTYAYLSPQFQAEIDRRAIHGATVDRIPIKELGSWPIAVPGLAEQRRIAGLLATLDELIEAERQAARQLDELVGVLGRQFLTDLSPVSSAPLAEIAEISKGYSYKSAELVEGGGWLVNLKNVGRDGSFQARGFKPLTGSPKPAQVVETGDILVAQTDLTQNREVIGRSVRVRRGLVEGPLTASLDLVIVRPGPQVTREYLFAVLGSPEFRAHALGFCNGTTVVHMGARAVPTFVAPVPPRELLEAFSARVALLRTEADAAIEAAERLERTRAELLPLLMSGGIRTREVAA
ncbi:MAG: restriction endonuclease subunit S [Actinomycetota bacterium]|nr:restriction endonuclease subunit S [Actinomycetota bacterium]